VPWRPLPRAGGPPPVRVAAPLARVLRHLGVPDTSTLPSLAEAWAEIVGPAVAAHTEPVTLRHGTLVVRVDDPAWAAQVRWMEAQLLAQLHAAPTFATVERIEVRVGPARW
jgi:predicted nucleic acid-binding Zn ribbon protein